MAGMKWDDKKYRREVDGAEMTVSDRGGLCVIVKQVTGEVTVTVNRRNSVTCGSETKSVYQYSSAVYLRDF